MFKLMYPDGQFSAGGCPSKPAHFWHRQPHFESGGIWFPTSKKGKVWSLINHIKSHLRHIEHYDYEEKKRVSDLPLLKGAVVIEYELVEKRRIPIEEFMKE